MSVNTDWDIEKHKLEHECDEHWELRKRFLEAHKDRFPEDQLVCLAQVFTNIEFLGCRYPQETMDLVAELSKDVAKDFREKQKSKLQRTFVKASDAANAKAKGQQSPHIGSSSTHDGNDIKRHEKIDELPRKRFKVVHEQPYGKIVILEYPNVTPQATIDSSVKMSGQKIDWKFETKQNNKCRCEVYINNKKIAEGVSQNKKTAKAKAAKNGLTELQKYYYTIEVKQIWKDNGTKKQSELKSDSDSNKNSLTSDSIGAKLMKLMGWAGGGLGKLEQGIIEPVTLQRQISRGGFGLKLDSNNMSLFKKKCQETLRQYIEEGVTQDYLSFPDFTNEERAIMHECARKLGLKSQSHGPKNQRTLCISRKIKPSDLISELIEIGGHSEQYTLKSPTNMKNNS
ncbi:NF-kappa-B-repressing factor [Chelonus insularis]|uniref:NF-kappa-B-repressing factor n=1 Tax=Chelonus insularis TaxID=460826 RepID=UPI001589CE04|nr:NF-kappa-B-repressing factor [Chelonus insularis]